jgi:chromosome segregation ATPase
MPPRTDTYERAYACCDQVLFEDGKFPTIDAIRERIQVNSPAVITRAIKDWTLHFVDRHREKLERPAIPPLLLDSAESLWRLALDEANRALQEREMALAEKERGWQAELEQLRNTLDTQTREARHEAERLERELQQKQSTLDELGNRLSTTTETLAVRERELAEMRQAASRAEGSLAEARAAQEAQAKAWTERFDSDHAWHLKRIEEEKTLARVRADQEIADKSAALATARGEIEALRRRLTDSQDQVRALIERQGAQERELEGLRSQLAAAEKALVVEREKNRKVTAIVRRQRRPV